MWVSTYVTHIYMCNIFIKVLHTYTSTHYYIIYGIYISIDIGFMMLVLSLIYTIFYIFIFAFYEN